MRSISPGLIATCTIPLLFGSPLSVHAETQDHDVLDRVLTSSDTVATVTEGSFVMNADCIQWIHPDLGFFTSHHASSPFDRLNTDRILAGLATEIEQSHHGTSDIIGVSLSWDRIQDQGRSTQSSADQDYVHRFIAEAFYGFRISTTVTLQPSMGLLTESSNSDLKYVGHIGLSLRF